MGLDTKLGKNTYKIIKSMKGVFGIKLLTNTSCFL